MVVVGDKVNKNDHAFGGMAGKVEGGKWVN